MRVGSFLVLILLAMQSQPVTAADGDQSRAVRLRLSNPGVANGASATTQRTANDSPADVDVLGEAAVAGSPAKQRNPQLSEDHLVVIGVDANGVEVARTAILDPSLIRAEGTDSQGRVVSRRLFRDSVDFSVILPNDPRIDSVQIFRPRWTGSVFELDLVGSDSLR